MHILEVSSLHTGVASSRGGVGDLDGGPVRGEKDGEVSDVLELWWQKHIQIHALSAKLHSNSENTEELGVSSLPNALMFVIM